MKVDSMISAMREKSIQKDKQKSDLLLYEGAKPIKEKKEETKINPKQASLRSQEATTLSKEVSAVSEKASVMSEKAQKQEESAAVSAEAQNSESLSKLKFQKAQEMQKLEIAAVKSEETKSEETKSEETTLEEITKETIIEETIIKSEKAVGNMEAKGEEEVFEMLETAIEEIKSKLISDFAIKQPKEIYEQYDIDADVKNGIFMIDMYRDNMPAEMDDKLKRKSIMDILQAFEISTKDLEQDAAQKQEALKNELKLLRDHVKESIFEKKKRIKKLEKSIMKMKMMISDIEEYCKEQTSIIKEEQARIDSTLKFMKGRKTAGKK